MKFGKSDFAPFADSPKGLPLVMVELCMRAFALKLLREIRGMPFPVHVLVGGHFINRFGSFVMPFLALYLSDRGISLGNVAAVLVAMSLGGLLAPVVSGYLSDAIGRRNTICLSLVTSAVSIFALYYCQSLPQLVAVATLHGFCSHLYSPAANALLTDLVGMEQRVIAFAYMRLAINAGFAAGPAVAGLLFSRAPMLIFVGDAVTTLIFAGLALMWLPHGLRTVTGRVSSPRVIWQSWREALVHMAGNRPFRIYLLAALCMEIAFVQVFNVLSLSSTDRGLSPAQYGIVMGLNGALIMLIELPLNQWARRFNLQRVMVVGFVLTGLGCAAFGLMHTQMEFFAAMTLFTIGEMLSLPISMSYLSNMAPEQFRGRYYGIKGICWALAGMAGSSGVWFYGQMGDHWWYLAGGIGMLGGLIMLGSIYQQRASENTSV